MASLPAASASFVRPRAANRVARLFSDVASSGPVCVRAGRGQLSADSDSFLDRGQRLFPSAQARQDC